MKPYLKLIPISLFLFLSNLTIQAQGIQVTNLDGGSVVTELSSDNKLNDKSSLRRTWFVMNDSSCPIQISDAGIQTKYKYEQSYYSQAVGSMKMLKEVRAFEVRYVLYDVFGDYITTLSETSVEDLSSNSAKQLDGRWGAQSYVSDLLTVVTFVAQVRTENGNVWRYDQKGIGGELEKINLKVTGVLEQKARDK